MTQATQQEEKVERMKVEKEDEYVLRKQVRGPLMPCDRNENNRTFRDPWSLTQLDDEDPDGETFATVPKIISTAMKSVTVLKPILSSVVLMFYRLLRA